MGTTTQQIKTPTGPTLSPRTTSFTQGSFAVLQHLLLDSNECVQVYCDPKTNHLVTQTDRAKILPDAKESLGRMLLKIHIWRCTADVQACGAYYEDLIAVSAEHEQ